MPETVPLSGGAPPARRDVKGDTAKRNKLILEIGAREAVNQGLIGIQQMAQVQKSINLYHGLGEA